MSCSRPTNTCPCYTIFALFALVKWVLIIATIGVWREGKEFQTPFFLSSWFATLAWKERNQMKTLTLIQSKSIFLCICLIFWSEMYYAESSTVCGRMKNIIFLLIYLWFFVLYIWNVQSIKSVMNCIFLIFFFPFLLKPW